jgi:nucleoside-diphosphate-sugar epimerase
VTARPDAPACLVTGATGFIGGRLARMLIDSGHPVRALVRDPDQAEAVHAWGVELVRGDLGDPASLHAAVSGVQRVFHCAGVVGDWVQPSEAARVNVEGTRAVLSASAAAGVGRVVHLSSLAVFGTRHHHGTDESAPHRYSGDLYGDSKLDGERVAQGFIDRGELDVVILRPGFVYGPGDRQFLPRLLDALAGHQFAYVGNGGKLLNIVHVDDLAAAAMLAQSVPQAAGKAFNLTDGTQTSLRSFVEFLCETLEIPAPRRRIPVPVAGMLCYASELAARLMRSQRAPRLNRGRLKFLHYNQHYSIERAWLLLGYRPQLTYREGLPSTLAWFREQSLLPVALLRSRSAASPR